MTVCLALINYNSVQETFATDSCDHWAVDILQALTELVTHCLCTLDHVLLLNEFQGTDGDS